MATYTEILDALKTAQLSRIQGHGVTTSVSADGVSIAAMSSTQIADAILRYQKLVDAEHRRNNPSVYLTRPSLGRPSA